MKARLFRVCLLAFLSLYSAVSFAQGTVKGVMVDASNNEGLIGAAVVVKGTTNGTATLFDGSFELKVPTGETTLIFTYIGYINVEKTVSVKEGEVVEMGDVALESNTVGLDEVLVVTSFARDRQTPVALSTIQPELIAEKLGTQEFPEVLKSTPSVYATKGGGGFGDSRVNIRGFDSNNIGVLINGVPVNDMESGKVYWSNWAGLSDVTQTMQVQRGLGASKLAISSTGGTINIITKSTDAVKGGTAYAGIGNDGFRKYAFSVSTGLLENGWAVTASAAHTFGDGYIDGTNFDGYSYFLNVSKLINDDHRLSFTIFGAPQWHNQRGNKHLIATYRGDRPTDEISFPIQSKYRFNSDYGYRNGEVYGGGYGYNEYHKPQASLNHFWNINETTILSTSVYASITSGGGRRIDGPGKNMLSWNRYDDMPYAESVMTPEGHFDFDAVAEINAASLNGSQAVIGQSVNSHEWYGFLSSLNTTVGNINVTAGLDGRYYVGKHAKEVEDLLGGAFFLETSNQNRPENSPLKKGDNYAYKNDGRVRWLGLFGQAEYVTEDYTAFLSASVSHQGYQRVDYFQYAPGDQTSDWVDFLPWSVKGGANYNIDEHHNVFVNGGYFTRAPYFNFVFKNYTNVENEDVKYEKILSTEIGYGYTSTKFNAKVNLYRTNWKDKGLRRTIGQESVNIPGLNALHQGVEVEATYRPFPKTNIRAMFSWGDWVWQDDVNFELYDDNNNFLGNYNAYIGDVHVGNSAQMTAALGVDTEVLPKLKLGVDANYYGKNFAEFDPTNRTNADAPKTDSWEMPEFVLVDMNVKYKFKFGGFDATLYGKVNNLFDTVYIADADDGSAHNAESALVYYGFGRTWSTGVKIRF